MGNVTPFNNRPANIVAHLIVNKQALAAGRVQIMFWTR